MLHLFLFFFYCPQAVEEAFSSCVEAVCQAPVIANPEVAPEVQLLKASVAFGLYVKKCYPELKDKVQSAMAMFLNRRVEPWVVQQGGWVSRFLFFLLWSYALVSLLFW